MKIAHLILCHAYPGQLKRLVGKLAHEDAHFYIHVDRKAGIDPFLPVGNEPGVFFIERRVKVKWAGYSQVQAILNSLEEILASGTEYDYINVLSGQDYPIKSTSEIHKFLADHPGKAFMHTLRVEDEWKEAMPRLTKYHLSDWSFPGKFGLERLMNAILPRRKQPGSIVFVGRSSWFTLTPVCAAYILKYIREHTSFRRFFRLTWGADEMVFQTVLYNSPLREHMENDNLLYVDWSEGKRNPKVLTMDDAGALKTSKKFFARKFNSDIDNKILDYLDSITF